MVGASPVKSVCWDGDRWHPGGRVILCGDTMGVGGGGVRSGECCLHQKDIGWQEERSGKVKNKYVTISDGS